MSAVTDVTTNNTQYNELYPHEEPKFKRTQRFCRITKETAPYFEAKREERLAKEIKSWKFTSSETHIPIPDLIA